MSRQADLFEAPLLPGLAYTPSLVDAGEEPTLIAAIDAIDLSPFRFHGWLGKRRTASFGWAYDFDNASFLPAQPIPEWLLPLRTRAAGFAGLEADALAQALVTRYDPGAGIGWHRDRPVFDKVVGISLGAPAVMRFRRRLASGFERRSLPLEPRSAYLLDGEARAQWQHSISPQDQPRWSITFRSVKQQP